MPPRTRARRYGLLQLHLTPQTYNASGEVADATFAELVKLYARHDGNGELLYLEVCSPPDPTGTDDADADAVQSGCATTWSQERLYEWIDAKPKLYDSESKLFDDFRVIELSVVEIDGCFDANKAKIAGATGCTSKAAFNISAGVGFDAWFNVMKTIFIMIVLGGGAIVFSKDAQVFVIGPIERMMALVKKLAENPLESAAGDGHLMDDEQDVREQGYETALLEQTIERVGQLLQIGFGAAGAEIIGKNLNSEGGKLNAMLPGKKITAIYGFCDIRQFTDTTECLQEEVMVYVNKLGNIVHGAAHAYYGMANKNVGDAFLLSWKLCDGEMAGFARFEDGASEEQRKKANETVRCPALHPSARGRRQITPSEMADSAVTAFLKTIIDLDNENETGCLTEYGQHPAVIKRFGEGFKIKMGFGMHVGWAVEGAIGSELKIDATYLSPHVEMSDRLEAASKIFGAKLNMSHWLVGLTSLSFRKYIRPIDTIIVEGCDVPLTVWTYDVENHKPKFGTQVFDETRGVPYLTDWDMPEFAEIQQGMNPSFMPTYKRGYEAYIRGDWDSAKDFLAEALLLKSKDGPTMHLLGVMDALGSAKGGVAPADWKGHHELPEF